MKASILLFLLAYVPGGVFCYELPLIDPVGESIQLVLNKSRNRTSRLIKSGKATGEVMKFIPGPDGVQGKYQVALNFNVSIRFVGRQEKAQTMLVPSEYFTPDFLGRLRSEGQYLSEDFKIKYLSREDVRTSDGTLYPDCDRILLYDLKLDPNSPLSGLIAGAAGADSGGLLSGNIKNLTIVAMIKEDFPVLGIVKIDIKGKVGLFPVRLGFDSIRSSIIHDDLPQVE